MGGVWQGQVGSPRSPVLLSKRDEGILPAFDLNAMMIEVQDLTKYYGPHLAISRVSFAVAAGEIVGFLGPNGAGKTTTLKILAGYLTPTSGSARINGYDVLSESLQARRSLGYLPENVPLYPDLTVRQFLEFAARAKGVAGERRGRRWSRW